jgi:hypothetical protein
LRTGPDKYNMPKGLDNPDQGDDDSLNFVADKTASH